MSESPEFYMLLEQRLVAYLKSLSALPGSPLTDGLILEGHSEIDLDNEATWISILAERADTQMYESGGLEIVDLKIMVQTQADDVSLAVHNARVSGVRAVFALQNLPQLKAAVNAAPGFGLTGLKAGKPPLEDGFDSVKKRRQALFRFQAIGGLEL